MNDIKQQRLDKVTMIAKDLIKYYNPVVQLKFNKRFKRVLGQYNIRKNLIQLQYHYALYGRLDYVIDTILHEIAHSIASPYAKHNSEWKAIAKQLGCVPKARKPYIAYNDEIKLDE